MTGPCFEVVVYEVAETAAADVERQLARERIMAFPRFISWTPLSGIEDARTRVDLVVWSCLEVAVAAGKKVGTAAEFAAFRNTINHVAAMGHYTSTAAPLQL
ncbi:hypothetical protein CYK37_12010 [Mesorhizobium loti]|nr:hypothetical protein [Mesorhizobium loti]PLP59190.1 hypothetical protein CYK37_12010 [Mesorhizobium loti]